MPKPKIIVTGRYLFIANLNIDIISKTDLLHLDETVTVKHELSFNNVINTDAEVALQLALLNRCLKHLKSCFAIVSNAKTAATADFDKTEIKIEINNGAPFTFVISDVESFEHMVKACNSLFGMHNFNDKVASSNQTATAAQQMYLVDGQIVLTGKCHALGFSEKIEINQLVHLGASASNTKQPIPVAELSVYRAVLDRTLQHASDSLYLKRNNVPHDGFSGAVIFDETNYLLVDLGAEQLKDEVDSMSRLKRFVGFFDHMVPKSVVRPDQPWLEPLLANKGAPLVESFQRGKATGWEQPATEVADANKRVTCCQRLSCC